MNDDELKADPAGGDPSGERESDGDGYVDPIRHTSARVERLLGELRASTAPATWTRIGELVQSLTSIYGAGFARMLEVFADGKGIDPRTRAELCDDSLICSLLLLHGLHPAPLEERVTRAIEHVRRALGSKGGAITSSVSEASGVAKVQLSGDWRDGPLPASAIEAALRRAIDEAAPDLRELDIHTEGGFRATTTLVQIDLKRSRPDPGTGVAP
jgi:hypothetical protein